MRISVIGTGYLGATHAACLAHWGHEVVGLDRSEERVARLAQGRAPLFEPGLDDLLAGGVSAGRLRFTTDPAEIGDCEVHFICVGTPQADAEGHADLQAVESAVESLGSVRRSSALVVGKSTVPVGTAARLRERLRQMGSPELRLAWNPEFLREGQAVTDSLHPERVVLGVEDPADDMLLRRVYAPLVRDGVPVISTDMATAELAKASANLMLAARISLVNVLAEVCEHAGANAADLTRIIGLDSRIGRHMLTPGVGYGGGCLPKDSLAFAARAQELGVPVAGELVAQVDRINRHQVDRTVDLAAELAGGTLAGVPVAVLGGTFKGLSDDLRESPALAIANRLAGRGAVVRLHDPVASEAIRRECPHLEASSDVLTTCRGAELVLVLTDWPQFADLDPFRIAELVTRRVVLDGRQVLDPEKWRAAGWRVWVLGSGDGACAS